MSSNFSEKVKGFIGKYKNGTIGAAGAYTQTGKKTGDWIYCAPDGSIESKGLYQNDIRVGTWTFYKANIIVRKDIYRKGNLIERRHYTSGRLSAVEHLIL